MLIETFILENRKEIDDYIRDVYPKAIVDSNEEREIIIMNDHSLWSWAQREGCDI